MSAIVEIIEFSEEDGVITGSALDWEGREYKFQCTNSGKLLKIFGNIEELPRVWALVEKELSKEYSKLHIDKVLKDLVSFKKEALKVMQQLQFALGNIEEKIEDLTKERVVEVIQDFQPSQNEQPVFEQEEELPFQRIEEDYSDEDLANHALRVLSGEVPLVD